MAEETQIPPPQQQSTFKPVSSQDPAALAAEFDKAEGNPAPENEAKPSTPPAKPAEDDVPELVKKARDRDAQRKMQEAKEVETAKPYLDALKVIPPHTASAIAKAIQSGDPVSLLAAAGMTHQQYTARLLGQAEPEAEKPQAKEAEANPEVSTLKQRLEHLERERENERLQVSRKEAMSRMESLVKENPKFKHINGLGDYAGIERTILQYINENGRPPGDTFEESVRLAAELYEYDLKQQAEKWKKVLTPAQEAAQTLSPKAPETPSAGTETVRTLTNGLTQPGAPRTAPKTRQELIQAFIEKGEEALG